MADIKRKGYGQVEPNHLSGIVKGEIYAQLPATYTDGEGTSAVEKPITQLEQGQFLIYDYANNRCARTGDGEYMLVYCEEKLYDERYQSHKDFVLLATDFTDGKIYPRLIKTGVGDIMTINSIGTAGTGKETEVTIGTDAELVKGAYLQVDPTTSFLKVAKDSSSNLVTDLTDLTGMVWKIVKVYTMPDSQPGFKVQRVQ
jgi:hypothetical protein